jgi:hypothetical protein
MAATGRCGPSGPAIDASLSAAFTFLPLRGLPPWTVTKLGQKPFDAGEVLVAVALVDLALAAERVSFGSTLTQLDFCPQSPQPSQTSVDDHALLGSTILPRLRRRRFSVAQVWS